MSKWKEISNGNKAVICIAIAFICGALLKTNQSNLPHHWITSLELLVTIFDILFIVYLVKSFRKKK